MTCAIGWEVKTTSPTSQPVSSPPIFNLFKATTQSHDEGANNCLSLDVFKQGVKSVVTSPAFLAGCNFRELSRTCGPGGLAFFLDCSTLFNGPKVFQSHSWCGGFRGINFQLFGKKKWQNIQHKFCWKTVGQLTLTHSQQQQTKQPPQLTALS